MANHTREGASAPQGAGASGESTGGFTLESMADELGRLPIDDRLKELGRKAKAAARYAVVKDWTEDEVEAALLPVVVTEACKVSDAHRAFAAGWAEGLLDPVEPKGRRKREVGSGAAHKVERTPCPDGKVEGEHGAALGFTMDTEGRRWRFVEEVKEWRRFDGGWSRPADAGQTVTTAMDDFAEASMVVWKDREGWIPDPRRLRYQTVRGAIGLYRERVPINTSLLQWDRVESGLFGLPDGRVLDLGAVLDGVPVGLAIRDATMEDLIMRRLGAVPDPDPLHPNRGIGAWRRMLDESIPEKEERTTFMLWLGDVLRGRPPQVAPLLIGPPASGKSSLAEGVARAFGGYASLLPGDAVWSPPRGVPAPSVYKTDVALGRLQGARLAVVSDAPRDGQARMSSTFRSIIGDERIHARVGNRLIQIPRPGVVLVANRFPVEMDAPDRRRVFVVQVPNERKPEEQDPRLGEKLDADAGALLGFVLAAMVANPEGYRVPPESTRALVAETYAADEARAGTLRGFVQARLVPAKDGFVWMDDLTKALYAEVDRASCPENHLPARLAELGVRTTPRRVQRGGKRGKAAVGWTWKDGAPW